LYGSDGRLWCLKIASVGPAGAVLRGAYLELPSDLILQVFEIGLSLRSVFSGVLACVLMFPNVPIECPEFNYEAFGPRLASVAFAQAFVVCILSQGPAVFGNPSQKEVKPSNVKLLQSALMIDELWLSGLRRIVCFCGLPVFETLEN